MLNSLEVKVNNGQQLLWEVAAIVYECTLLPPTSAAVQEATGLPVFDVITLIKWAYSAVVQKKFDGFM